MPRPRNVYQRIVIGRVHNLGRRPRTQSSGLQPTIGRTGCRARGQHCMRAIALSALHLDLEAPPPPIAGRSPNILNSSSSLSSLSLAALGGGTGAGAFATCAARQWSRLADPNPAQLLHTLHPYRYMISLAGQQRWPCSLGRKSQQAIGNAAGNMGSCSKVPGGSLPLQWQALVAQGPGWRENPPRAWMAQEMQAAAPHRTHTVTSRSDICAS